MHISRRSDYSIADHLQYFGIDLLAESWGTCGIVIDESSIIDGANHNGNFVLSRDPFTSVIKLKSRSSAGLSSA